MIDEGEGPKVPVDGRRLDAKGYQRRMRLLRPDQRWRDGSAPRTRRLLRRAVLGAGPSALAPGRRGFLVVLDRGQAGLERRHQVRRRRGLFGLGLDGDLLARRLALDQLEHTLTVFV